MSPHDQIAKLLNDHGAVLIRQRKHQIWRLPDGRSVTIASTPSDHRAAWKTVALLRRDLGLVDALRGTPGPRPPRPLHHKNAPTPPKLHPSDPNQQNLLRLAGLTRSSPSQRVSALL